MADRSGARRGVRWLFLAGCALLGAHYLFVLVLSQRVSAVSVVLFGAALGCVVPAIRRRIGAKKSLPPIRRRPIDRTTRCVDAGRTHDLRCSLLNAGNCFHRSHCLYPLRSDCSAIQ